MRAYSSRHGNRRASGREATCRTCIALNHGSAGRFSTSKSGAASGGGGRIVIVRMRVARARSAAFEWGVGAATFAPPVRFARGVTTTPGFRREGVRGRTESLSGRAELVSLSEAGSAPAIGWTYSSSPLSSPEDEP